MLNIINKVFRFIFLVIPYFILITIREILIYLFYLSAAIVKKLLTLAVRLAIACVCSFFGLVGTIYFLKYIFGL